MVRSSVSVSLASHVKEGKLGEKAIDKVGKQYGENEGKDDGEGAECDETETQGEEHYEGEDDDLSGETSEAMKDDFSLGIDELQMEEQQDPGKVAIFE